MEYAALAGVEGRITEGLCMGEIIAYSCRGRTLEPCPRVTESGWDLKSSWKGARLGAGTMQIRAGSGICSTDP